MPNDNAMARAAGERQVAFRASMLPIGNYDDGSVAFPVWPQGMVDGYNAMARFSRGEPPQPEDAVLAGLAVTGGALGGAFARHGGNAMARMMPGRDRYMANKLHRQFPDEASVAQRPIPSRSEMMASSSEARRVYDDLVNAYGDASDALGINGAADPEMLRQMLWANGQQDMLGRIRALETRSGSLRAGARDDAMRYNKAADNARGGNARPINVFRTKLANDLYSNPAPAGAPGALSASGSSEHHSRSQPRGQAGRWAAPESFDAYMHGLNQMLVDLDGDGQPDAVVPAPQGNAMAQAAPDYLRQRGYQDQLPPAVSAPEVWTQEMQDEYARSLFSKQDELMKQGMTREQAVEAARGHPDIKAARERILKNAPQGVPSDLQQMLNQ